MLLVNIFTFFFDLFVLIVKHISTTSILYILIIDEIALFVFHYISHTDTNSHRMSIGQQLNINKLLFYNKYMFVYTQSPIPIRV